MSKSVRPILTSMWRPSTPASARPTAAIRWAGWPERVPSPARFCLSHLNRSIQHQILETSTSRGLVPTDAVVCREDLCWALRPSAFAPACRSGESRLVVHSQGAGHRRVSAVVNPVRKVRVQTLRPTARCRPLRSGSRSEPSGKPMQGGYRRGIDVPLSLRIATAAAIAPPTKPRPATMRISRPSGWRVYGPFGGSSPEGHTVRVGAMPFWLAVAV